MYLEGYPTWASEMVNCAYLPDGKPYLITHGNGLTMAHSYDGKGNLQTMQLATADGTSRLYRNYWSEWGHTVTLDIAGKGCLRKGLGHHL